MSTAISKALVARWTGAETINPLYPDAIAAQTQLATLLTTDPNSDPLAPVALTWTDPISRVVRPRTASDAVRWGSKGVSVVFPEITFRPSAGTADRRFAVDYPVYDVEIWDNSESGTLLTDILDCLTRMVDMRPSDDGTCAPPLVLETGRCYWAQTLVTGVAWYDSQIKSWFMLWRLQMTEGR